MSGIVESGTPQKGMGEIIPEVAKLGAGADRASVILSRTTTRYYPNGAQTIKSNANRTLQFRIAASSMLDPMTSYLTFRALAHDPRTRLEDYAHSFIQKAVLKCGGVEIENIDRVDLAHRMLAYATSPKQYYEHTAAACQGAFKYAPKSGAALYAGAGGAGATSSLKAANQASVGSAVHPDSYPYFAEENPLWNQGDAVDNGTLGASTIGVGTHFQLPLSEIFGFFKTSKYIPLFCLGALDIELTMNDYANCCFEGKVYKFANADDANFPTNLVDVRAVDGTALDGNAVNAAKRVYELRDIRIHTDLCDADPVFTMLITQMASQSATGLQIPFTSCVMQQKVISNAGRNTISINKGVSFLRSVVVAMRPLPLTNTPMRQKSNFMYGDTFQQYQMTIGNKLYPQNPISDTTESYVELLKSMGLHNNISSGSVLTKDIYTGRTDALRSVAGGVANDSDHMSLPGVAPVVGSFSTTALADVDQQPKQQFLLGLNTEKVLQAGVLSGVNLRLSGFNIVLDLHLQTKTEALTELTARTGLAMNAAGHKTPAARLKPSLVWYDYDTEINVLMLIDKSVSIRADQVSVAE
jgi:hypothetical protein